MGVPWQSIIVGVIAGAAVLYLASRYLGWRRKHRACDSCALMKNTPGKQVRSGISQD